MRHHEGILCCAPATSVFHLLRRGFLGGGSHKGNSEAPFGQGRPSWRTMEPVGGRLSQINRGTKMNPARRPVCQY